MIAARKQQYTKGMLVIIVETIQDPHIPLPKGLKGTVSHVDGIGTVHIPWENGSTLGVFSIITISINQI